MRSAWVRVMADAVVPVRAITGLLQLALDGPAGCTVRCAGHCQLFRGLLLDTGDILLDISPDPTMKDKLRKTIERDHDRLVDLYLW